MMSDLVDIRHAKGLTQFSLAVAAGVSLSTVSNFEAGRCVPSPRIRRKLADAYGVTIEQIAAACEQQHEPTAA
jgi:transcriptional regulator with XRE-family HTH domain